MSELEKTAYDRGFYNGIRGARQIFAKHLNVSTSTDEIKWDNVSKTDILSEIDDFMMKSESYSQLQLTIPKSIADKLDKFIKTDFESLGHEEWWIQENGLIEWFSKTPNCYIKDVYLAGKALGVDLVKVGEG